MYKRAFLILLLALTFTLASPLQAATYAEIQAQINVLMAQLKAMEGGASHPDNSSSLDPALFTQDLSFGMTNNVDVKRLQEFLISKGYFIGQASGNYFTVTQSAVARFQAANDLSVNGAYFGPESRALVNAFIVADAPQTPAGDRPSITIISPSGGEIYEATNDIIEIEYESQNVEGEKLTAYLYNGKLGNLDRVTGRAEESGTLKLDIRKGGGPSAGTYYINLCAEEVDNPNVPGKYLCTMSKSFSIVDLYSEEIVTITAPAAGWIVAPGLTYTIRWTGSLTEAYPDISNYGIYLYNDSTGYSTGIGTVRGSANSFSWTVPTNLKAGSGYTIAIGKEQIAESGTFTVSAAQRYPFTVISPASGETLKQGSTYKLTWSGYDEGVNSYSIYLVGGSLGSNGSTYLGTVNTDTKDWFSWTVPSNVPTGSGYQIQFSGARATGDNSGSFSISSNSVSSGDPHTDPDYKKTSSVSLNSNERTITYEYPKSACGTLMTQFTSPGSVSIGRGDGYSMATDVCSSEGNLVPNESSFRTYACENFMDSSVKGGAVRGRATFAFQCTAPTSSNEANTYSAIMDFLRTVSEQLKVSQ